MTYLEDIVDLIMIKRVIVIEVRFKILSEEVNEKLCDMLIRLWFDLPKQE